VGIREGTRRVQNISGVAEKAPAVNIRKKGAGGNQNGPATRRARAADGGVTLAAAACARAVVQ